MRDDLHARWSYEDLLRLPADGKRHELIGGEHLVSPSPTPRHQSVLLNLARLLENHARATGCGRVYVAPLDVVLSPRDVVEPDILFVAPGREEIVGERFLESAPDLAVEVVSTSSRRTDAVLKRHLYEKHGVAEYWLVDPDAGTVDILRRRGDRLRAEPVQEILATPLLPGLAIPLSEIFE